MIKKGTKLIYIYKKGIIDGFSYGKIYEIHDTRINLIYIRDDVNATRNCRVIDVFDYFKLALKRYPNTSLFKKLYPNGKEVNNMWEV